MKLIAQPIASDLCGQCCVAMAAGVSVRRAREIIGHDGGTETREVVRALRSLGVSCADRLVRISRNRPNLPTRAIVTIQEQGKRAHWMLTWDGTMYDPGQRWPEGYPGWRITSFLEIFRSEGK